jgi:hypothetical protein
VISKARLKQSSPGRDQSRTGRTFETPGACCCCFVDFLVLEVVEVRPEGPGSGLKLLGPGLNRPAVPEYGLAGVLKDRCGMPAGPVSPVPNWIDSMPFSKLGQSSPFRLICVSCRKEFSLSCRPLVLGCFLALVFHQLLAYRLVVSHQLSISRPVVFHQQAWRGRDAASCRALIGLSPVVAQELPLRLLPPFALRCRLSPR